MTSSSKLVGLHPSLIAKIEKILSAMESLGFPMIITDGVRTTEEQAALFQKGRTVPGPKVTNVDGIVKKSNHQVKPDGYGHAADLTFLVDGKPSWSLSLHWDLYGEMAIALGLEWGGNWTSLKDLPHIELKA